MWILVACLFSFAAVQHERPADQPRGARVYIYTAESPSGGGSEEEQGRRDSVRDLRDAMAHKKGITLVDDRDRADVVVEVIGREKREGPEGGFGGKSVTQFGDTILRLRVKAGDAESEIKGIGQAYWGRAAKDAADRLTKWIARHQQGATRHSSRNAAIGSTRDARQAGKKHAASDAQPSTATTATYVAGSVGVTPKRTLVSARPETRPSAHPIARPATVRRSPSWMTDRRIWRAEAPSAIRSPKSRVRRFIVNVSTAY
jgi:hypothetical protein